MYPALFHLRVVKNFQGTWRQALRKEHAAELGVIVLSVAWRRAKALVIWGVHSFTYSFFVFFPKPLGKKLYILSQISGVFGGKVLKHQVL